MVALICQLTRTPAPLPGRQPVMMTLFTFSEFYSPEFFEEARRIYESGLSLLQSARRLKRSKAYVRDTLIAGGVFLRPSTHAPEGKKARSERRMAGTRALRLGVPPGAARLQSSMSLASSDLWKKGRSARSIAIQLNEAGVPSKKEKQWDHSAVIKVIKLYEKSPDLLVSVSRGAGLNSAVPRLSLGSTTVPAATAVSPMLKPIQIPQAGHPMASSRQQEVATVSLPFRASRFKPTLPREKFRALYLYRSKKRAGK